MPSVSPIDSAQTTPQRQALLQTVQRAFGFTPDEMASAQQGPSDDPRTAAALAFVRKVVHSRAQVSAHDMETLRQAGFGDAHMADILAQVVLNVFTNDVTVALDAPADATLYHDGCSVCLSIEATLMQLLKGSGRVLESVNLGLDKRRGGEAMVRGVSRLPSLVIDNRVIRLDDHSPIAHYVADDEAWMATALAL